MCCISIFGLLEQILTELQILCKFAHLYTMSSGIISLLRVGTNSTPINSEKSTMELNGPHYTEQKTLNLTLDLEIHQHLGSLKHVINLIMWIRDTGCYMSYGM
jgi:hypothetical protein